MTQTIAQCALQGASELLSRYQRGERHFPQSCLEYAFLRGGRSARGQSRGIRFAWG